MKRYFYNSLEILCGILLLKCGLEAAVNVNVTQDIWNIGSGSSNLESPPIDIQNNGEPVRINVRASNSANWHLSNVGRLNAFAIEWGSAGDWHSIFNNDSIMFTNIPSNGSQSFALRYHPPTFTIPLVNGIQQVSSITLTAYSSYLGTNWNIISTGAPSGFGLNAVIAKDAADEFHVAYLNSNNYLGYSDFGGVPVEVSTDDAWVPTIGKPISLVMDKNGDPHILYPAYYNTGDDGNWMRYVVFRYAWRQNGVWHVIDASDRNMDIYDNINVAFSLALDSHDLPHIAYAFYSGDAYYAHLEGSQFIKERLNAEPLNIEVQSPSLISIKIGADDLPHIAYADDRNWATDPILYYAIKNDDGWSINSFTGTYGFNSYSELISDAQDNFYLIGDRNDDGSYTAVVYKLNSDGSRTVICPLDGNYGPASILSFNIDSSGYPRLVYSYPGLNYAQWTGFEWLNSHVDEDMSSRAVSGFDMNGHPIVAYWYNNNFVYARLE